MHIQFLQCEITEMKCKFETLIEENSDWKQKLKTKTNDVDIAYGVALTIQLERRQLEREIKHLKFDEDNFKSSLAYCDKENKQLKTDVDNLKQSLTLYQNQGYAKPWNFRRSKFY